MTCKVTEVATAGCAEQTPDSGLQDTQREGALKEPDLSLHAIHLRSTLLLVCKLSMQVMHSLLPALAALLGTLSLPFIVCHIFLQLIHLQSQVMIMSAATGAAQTLTANTLPIYTHVCHKPIIMTVTTVTSVNDVMMPCLNTVTSVNAVMMSCRSQPWWCTLPQVASCQTGNA